VASFMGCMNIVIYLLQHGANANAPTMRGEAPLHLAARANQTDIVRILLRNNAQVDARARVKIKKKEKKILWPTGNLYQTFLFKK
jgi:ankyrin